MRNAVARGSLLTVILWLATGCVSGSFDGPERHAGEALPGLDDAAEVSADDMPFDWGQDTDVAPDALQADPAPDAQVAPDLAPDPGTADALPDPGAYEWDGEATVNHCKPGTQFIYVVNQENHLMRFDPMPKAFTDVGVMACVSGPFAATPFSMAIDREATAWVLYSDGSLYRVSTLDASCSPAAFQVGQQGFVTFGMGFASNSPGSQDETLFVSNAVFGSGTSQLGTISFPGLDLAEIGPFEPGIGSAELTGNGLGELWGFFPNGSLVAQVDKGTAALSNRINLPPGVISNARAWAFATWGGDFYLFFASQTDLSSSVYRVGKDGSFENTIADIGWNITGAGVSVCAPASH